MNRLSTDLRIRELESAAGQFRVAAEAIRRSADELPENRYRHLRASLENTAVGLELNAQEIADFLQRPTQRRFASLLGWTRATATAAVAVVSLAVVEGASSGVAETLAQAQTEVQAAEACAAEAALRALGDPQFVSPRFEELDHDKRVEHEVRAFADHVKRLASLLQLAKQTAATVDSAPGLLDLTFQLESAYLDSVEEYLTQHAEAVGHNEDIQASVAEDLAYQRQVDELRGR